MALLRSAIAFYGGSYKHAAPLEHFRFVLRCEVAKLARLL